MLWVQIEASESSLPFPPAFYSKNAVSGATVLPILTRVGSAEGEGPRGGVSVLSISERGLTTLGYFPSHSDQAQPGTSAASEAAERLAPPWLQHPDSFFFFFLRQKKKGKKPVRQLVWQHHAFSSPKNEEGLLRCGLPGVI